MRHIRVTSSFDRDFRLAIRRGKNIGKFKFIRDSLLRGEQLERKYRDHPLRGQWQDCRECHIESDWLLIYQIIPGEPDTVVLVRIGTHADLFQ